MNYPFDHITNFIFLETEIEKSDVILIPGGPHPQLMERASDIYRRQLAPYILPSGGTTKHVESTEWDFLYNVGLKLGVPHEVILKEDRAANTFENASYSWNVLQEAGIPVNKVILVCKAGHACRAFLTYKSSSYFKALPC